MNIPPKYEDVVEKLDAALAREAALREELAHMTALRDTWYEQYQEMKSSRQQRLTVAEQRASVMKHALKRIARPHDCGCLPCTGDCTSKLSLEITVDGMRETAELALKGLCETCHDQGEIFVSKGKFEYGMESEPDPIYKPCPVCSKAALKPATGRGGCGSGKPVPPSKPVAPPIRRIVNELVINKSEIEAHTTRSWKP